MRASELSAPGPYDGGRWNSWSALWQVVGSGCTQGEQRGLLHRIEKSNMRAVHWSESTLLVQGAAIENQGYLCAKYGQALGKVFCFGDPQINSANSIYLFICYSNMACVGLILKSISCKIFITSASHSKQNGQL